MFYVRLMGGLGNQMFQYAFGRSLSLKKNLKFSLDLTFLKDSRPRENFTKRNYELDVFLATPRLSYLGEGLKKKLVIRRHLYEKSMEYDCSLLDVLSRDLYIGYFQSPKYFSDVDDIIRLDFRFKNISRQSLEVVDEIKRCDSVSIHVRRGDYLTHPAAYSAHGVCTELYYSRAISFIKKHVVSPKFFVFSDDMPWVKENLFKEENVFFVSHNKCEKSYEDMYLMSQCKHNITANSSFSWWGAWLNSEKEKIVIVPEDWFADKTLSSKDMFPDEWVKISGR